MRSILNTHSHETTSHGTCGGHKDVFFELEMWFAITWREGVDSWPSSLGSRLYAVTSWIQILTGRADECRFWPKQLSACPHWYFPAKLHMQANFRLDFLVLNNPYFLSLLRQLVNQTALWIQLIAYLSCKNNGFLTQLTNLISRAVMKTEWDAKFH